MSGSSARQGCCVLLGRSTIWLPTRRITIDISFILTRASVSRPLQSSVLASVALFVHQSTINQHPICHDSLTQDIDPCKAVLGRTLNDPANSPDVSCWGAVTQTFRRMGRTRCILKLMRSDTGHDLGDLIDSAAAMVNS